MRLKAIALYSLLYLSLAVHQASADPRPNIVLLLAEDMSPRVGSFGDPNALTPNIDALAAEGVRFTQVFTPAPVCAPSRAALFTGLYPQSFGAQHMRARHEAVPPAEVKAFPEILRENGYFTINQGKTDYQFDAPASMWDVNRPDASLSDRDPDKPFFAVLQNHATHEAMLFNVGWWTGLKRLVKTGAACLPCAAAMLETFDPESMDVPPFLPDTPKTRKEIARLYRNIFVMDAWVGDVMGELRADDLLDDTIVIWTTDHGDGLPRSKRSLYDSGVHVPMVVRYPDEAGRGTEIDELISFVDLPAMILTLASVDLPGHLARNDAGGAVSSGRDYIFGGIDRMDEARYRSRMVRSKSYKYIRNFDLQNPILGRIGYRERLDSMSELRRLQDAGDLSPGIEKYFDVPPPVEELYDLRADPFEMENLATDLQYRDVLDEYRQVMGAWLDGVQDLSRMSEEEMYTFLWGGETQPRTRPPRFEALGESGTARLSVRSETEGASIEYRFPSAQDSSWKLYTAPIDVDGRAEIEARAFRYGFVPSEVVRATSP
jgi:arylsulfatase A-like enzyme